MDYDHIVRAAIDEHRVAPIDVLGIGDAAGEYAYLISHEESYLRTVRDVDTLYAPDRDTRTLLEIGSFLGPVSISLKQMVTGE